jgi:protein SCO1/2
MMLTATIAALGVGVVASAPAAPPAPGEPDLLAAARMRGYFPNIALTTHENRQVRLYDDLLRDRAVVIAFMYTGCEALCPLAMNNLLAVAEALGERVGRDLFFYGLTLDPVFDTPEVLAAYARAIGAGPGVTFLTGREADITKVRRKLGVFDPDPVVDADRGQHSGRAVIGNEPAGRWAAVPALAAPKRILRTIARVAPAAAA